MYSVPLHWYTFWIAFQRHIWRCWWVGGCGPDSAARTSWVSTEHESSCWPAGGQLVCQGLLKTNDHWQIGTSRWKWHRTVPAWFAFILSIFLSSVSLWLQSDTLQSNTTVASESQAYFLQHLTVTAFKPSLCDCKAKNWTLLACAVVAMDNVLANRPTKAILASIHVQHV